MIQGNCLTTFTEKALASRIQEYVPRELDRNIIIISGSSLGNCVFIIYWSNTHIGRDYSENSKHYFKIALNLNDGYKIPTGMCTIECWNYRNIKPIRGNKKPIEKAIVKLGKYLKESQTELLIYTREEKINNKINVVC